MAKKRGNGEGSVFQRADGKWVASVSVWDANGERKRVTRIRDRRTDAAAVLRQLLDNADRGDFTSGSLTVGEFLNEWMKTVRAERAPNTVRAYGRSVRLHLVPRIGKVKLKTINALHINRLKDDMASVGSSARQCAFQILRTSLNEAVAMGLLATNPCRLVKAPPHTPKRIDPFTQDEAVAILDSTSTGVFAAVYEVAFGLGMRYGEIMGLHWSDIRFDEGIIYVHRQFICGSGIKPHITEILKTDSSCRTLNAPQRVLTALNDRRAVMMSQGLAKDERVFCGDKGGHIWPTNWYRGQWTPTLKRLGIRHRGIHHARHTYATLQLRAGIPVHIVSGILGHKNSAMTQNIYAHLMEGDSTSAADSIDRMFG